MLRSEEVVTAAFTQTRFRGGYDEREVEQLLGLVVDHLPLRT